MKIFTHKELAEMTLEEAQSLISNEVYAVSLLIEQLEDAGKVFGNGHHAAQKIAKFAEETLTERWKQ